VVPPLVVAPLPELVEPVEPVDPAVDPEPVLAADVVPLQPAPLKNVNNAKVLTTKEPRRNPGVLIVGAASYKRR
jgi:hypothetical protein